MRTENASQGGVTKEAAKRHELISSCQEFAGVKNLKFSLFQFFQNNLKNDLLSSGPLASRATFAAQSEGCMRFTCKLVREWGDMHTVHMKQHKFLNHSQYKLVREWGDGRSGLTGFDILSTPTPSETTLVTNWVNSANQIRIQSGFCIRFPGPFRCFWNPLLGPAD